MVTGAASTFWPILETFSQPTQRTEPGPVPQEDQG